MRVGIALVGVVVFVGMTYGVISYLKGLDVSPTGPTKKVTSGEKSSSALPDAPKTPEVHQTTADPRGDVLRATKEKYVPPVSSTGPWPKAVVPETEYIFGRMEVGEEDSHEFVIRNEGDAPLEIAKGDTTCQCTISELDDNIIPVGGEAKITLRWKPTVQSETFEKGAEIRTNDPKNKVFHLKIVGMVVPRLLIVPSETWEIREVNEGTVSTAVGFIVSPVLTDLDVEKLEFNEDQMTVKMHKPEAEMLKQLNGQSGVGFEVLVKPGMAVGGFSFPLKIYTNTKNRRTNGELGDQAVLDVNITGRREGPIKMHGSAMSPDGKFIKMGSFSAAEGRTISISLLVRGGPEGGLKFTSVEVEPQDLEVKLEPNTKTIGSSVRYTVTFRYPPGGSRLSRRDENPGSVRIKTNHAEAKEIELKVDFAAY